MEDRFSEILRRARAGDSLALEELLERHLPGLRAFVRLRSGRDLRVRESASDLVQSTCRELLQDLPHIECPDEGSFKQWLFRVALNKISKKREFHTAQKRDIARERPLATSEGVLLEGYAPIFTPSQDVAALEEVGRIERAFDRLPEDFRDVIVDARILGLSTRDIAEQSGRSEEAVRKLLSRARARLGILLSL